jgi:hypothetical protein
MNLKEDLPGNLILELKAFRVQDPILPASLVLWSQALCLSPPPTFLSWCFHSRTERGRDTSGNSKFTVQVEPKLTFVFWRWMSFLLFCMLPSAYSFTKQTPTECLQCTTQTVHRKGDIHTPTSQPVSVCVCKRGREREREERKWRHHFNTALEAGFCLWMAWFRWVLLGLPHPLVPLKLGKVEGQRTHKVFFGRKKLLQDAGSLAVVRGTWWAGSGSLRIYSPNAPTQIQYNPLPLGTALEESLCFPSSKEWHHLPDYCPGPQGT